MEAGRRRLEEDAGMDRRAHLQHGTRLPCRVIATASLAAIAELGAAVPAGPAASPHDGSPPGAAPVRSSVAQAPRSAPSGNPFRPGVVLVGFRLGVSTGQRYAIERAAGGDGASYLGPQIRPVRAPGAALARSVISPLKR